MIVALKTSIAAVAAFSAIPLLAASTVTVELAGLKAGAGDLYVSLQTRDQFMKPTGSYGSTVAKPAPGAARVVLTGVAPGTYAASVWHDVNGNRAFDVTGSPPDGWAMLNADALRAKPTFDQVSFTVGDDRLLSLQMRYGYGR